MVEGILGTIVARKKDEVQARLAGARPAAQPTRRSLAAVLRKPGARFVMEVKKASPSGHRSALSVEQAVAAYAPVADAISVLTDHAYFGGSLDDLRTARAGFDGPILAKDFIVDPAQVDEARAHGADAVLVILAALPDREARAIMDAAAALAMDVIVEVHDEQEVERALALDAGIVGINNRDLRTLKTDLSVAERLAPLVPADRIVIAESGIAGRADVLRLAGRVDAFLVGSSLMAAPDIRFAARALAFGPVKICGLTRQEDVDRAARAGATHAGFIFAPGTPRAVGDEAAGLVGEAHRHGLTAVGVFRDQDADAIAALVRAHRLDAVQVHGSQDLIDRLRPMIPDGCELWAVCAVGESAEPARTGADRTLFDTRTGATSGGSGRTFAWDLLTGRADLPGAFIAGGIGPANARAAQAVGAFGIDVGSALESEPRIKDAAAIARLFDAIRPGARRDSECA